MIRYAHPLCSGHAIHVVLQPPPGAVSMRLLRRWDAEFIGWDDPEAFLVQSSAPCAGVTDWRGLIDDVPVYYCAYYRVSDQWQASAVVTATPVAQVYLPHPEALDVLRERIEQGLNALVQADVLRHPSGAFSVLTAPPQIEQATFPVVSIQMQSDSPEMQFIGADVTEAFHQPDGAGVQAFSGYLSRVQLQVGIMSLNPDERRLLRRAIQEQLVRDVPVLEQAGVQALEMTFNDDEDFVSFDAPLYRSIGHLSCLSMTRVYESLPELLGYTGRMGVYGGEVPLVGG